MKTGIILNMFGISAMFIAVSIARTGDNQTSGGIAFQYVEMLASRQDSISMLIDAMIQVESKGNDSAYCKREEAVGCLQIRPIMLREVNRILAMQSSQKRYKLSDRWSRAKSIEMFMVYKEYHHPHSTMQTIARCWNGGGDGHLMAETVGYWNRVKKEMAP